MSYQFDADEVPQFDERREDGKRRYECVACHCGEPPFDHDTGLCRHCWRVVILGPAMENE